MSVAAKMKAYPHISNNPNISNGDPFITGTRITVRTIAGYYQMGMDVDEILSSLSHLKASEVHSALAYYFDHQVEIDEKLRENADEKYWKTKISKHPKEQVN
jgi:uncharacterized protein (DUF433 family)